MKKIALCFLLASCAAVPTHGGWQLSNDRSTISFVTTKVTDIAEVHEFRSFDGSMSDNGSVSVRIDLASVDTNIEIRDQRMRDMLFETGSFASATLSANVEAAAVDRLSVGESMSATIDGDLSLHGSTAPLSFDVIVTRSSASKLMVVSAKPVVVNAAQFNLVDGVERLREVAGLASISKAVPVSFVLSFDAR